MAVPLNGVYKARQSLLHRRRRPSGRDCVKRIPRPSAVRADHDGLNAEWIPRYRRPEEIVSVVASSGRLYGADAGGDWMGVYSMRIVMVGAGYVGLVSGACLADFGHEVVCVEVDDNKVVSLREGRVPIYEPGLSELALANQAAGRLSFKTSLKEAGRGAVGVFSL